jgi:uncharacterized protein YbgA (DUF1722 family)/uncharacterized protein YbbK (DUF523 family)
MKKAPENPEIFVGISRCLLGEEVRYDGGHKHDGFITGTLGKFFKWVPVCPEVEAGLGTPRESMRLVFTLKGVRLIGVRTQKDYTETLSEFSKDRVESLSAIQLCGYILKKDSPSCGMARVRVYGSSGMPQKQGIGLFAEALIERFPQVPVEEEGRLHDLSIRENFIERVFAYYRWSIFLNSKPVARDLIEFHTRHKLTILAHSRTHYDELGRLVARAGKGSLNPILNEYGRILSDGLKLRATSKKHANVLFHLMGYLKNFLDTEDKTELVECIDNYRKNQIPLIVPMTLLMHHFKKHPVQWVMSQTYLNPYPSELLLRNHV